MSLENRELYLDLFNIYQFLKNFYSLNSAIFPRYRKKSNKKQKEKKQNEKQNMKSIFYNTNIDKCERN